MKRIILVSGGIDSTLAWFFYQKKEFNQHKNIPVYVDFGQKYAKNEITVLKNLFKDNLEIIKIRNSVAVEFGANFISNRNMTLASVVTTLFNPDEIIIAGLKDDNCVDKNQVAFLEMSRLLSMFSKKNISVVSPFWQKTKGEIVEDYLNNGGESDILEQLFSCYNPKGGYCNNCEACFRRFVALRSNNVTVENINKDIAIKYLKKVHNYDLNRQGRIFIALKTIFKSLIAFDIDGTLTIEDMGVSYEKKKPNQKIIDKCNNLYNNNHLIVIYSARLGSDRELTEKWLKKHGVKYHSLILEKVSFDLFYDDKSINPEEKKCIK